MDSERLVVKLRDSVRLDRFLTQRLPRVSRTRIQRHIERGDVFVNGRAVRPSHRLSDGDVVTLPGLAERRLDQASQPVPFGVVYEDAHLLVIDKPAGVLVHPVGGEYQRTLLNGLHLWLRQRGEDARELGIVHRLDRLTSGLLIMAKTLAARRALSQAVEHRRVGRAYLALVSALPPQDRGSIDLHIRRNPSRPTRMETVVMPRPAAAGLLGAPPVHVSASGYSDPRRDVRPRPARTRYAVLRRLNGAALVRFVLETGRTHQIRVHALGAGFPLLGDPLYGPDVMPAWALGLARPALHASRLEFMHPVTGLRLRFQAPLPADLRALIQAGALPIRTTAASSPARHQTVGYRP